MEKCLTVSTKLEHILYYPITLLEITAQGKWIPTCIKRYIIILIAALFITSQNTRCNPHFFQQQNHRYSHSSILKMNENEQNTASHKTMNLTQKMAHCTYNSV